MLYMLAQYLYQLPIVGRALHDHQDFTSDVIGLKSWTEVKWDFEGVVVVIQWVFVILLFLLV